MAFGCETCMFMLKMALKVPKENRAEGKYERHYNCIFNPWRNLSFFLLSAAQ